MSKVFDTCPIPKRTWFPSNIKLLSRESSLEHTQGNSREIDFIFSNMMEVLYLTQGQCSLCSYITVFYCVQRTNSLVLPPVWPQDMMSIINTPSRIVIQNNSITVWWKDTCPVRTGSKIVLQWTPSRRYIDNAVLLINDRIGWIF